MKTLVLVILFNLLALPASSTAGERLPIHVLVLQQNKTQADLKQLEALIASGESVNRTDQEGRGPLHVLYVVKDALPEPDPVLEKMEEILISHGAFEWPNGDLYGADVWPDGEPDWDIRNGPGTVWHESPCKQSLYRAGDRSRQSY